VGVLHLDVGKMFSVHLYISIYISKISIDAYYVLAGVALEDPKTEDLSQEVRGFIFSKILVRSVQS
jgi:hypothetical protein